LCIILFASACQNKAGLSVDYRNQADMSDAQVDVQEDVTQQDDALRERDNVPVSEPDQEEYDYTIADALPDDGEPEPMCEETELMPPELRGDIEFAVSNPSDVVEPALGYDTRRGEILQRCVDGEIGVSNGQDVVYEVRELETRSDLSESLGVDVNVSIGFMGFGFSNHFNMARSRDVSEYDLNIWVRVRVTTGSEALVSDVAIRPEFVELIESDPMEFLERCGDRFVQSVTYGGELIVILSVATYSEDDRFALQNRLSARFGMWGSLGVGVESEFEEHLEGRDVTIQVTRTGGGGSLPLLTSAEELFAYASEFPAEVAANDPVVFRFVTRPYDRIHDGTICLPGFDAKSIMLMEEAWDILNEAVGVRNGLNEAIDNPGSYACGNNEDRRNSLEAMETYLVRLEEAASACAAELSNPDSTDRAGSCAELETVLNEYDPPDMPLRWQSLLTFEASARERYHTFFIPNSLVCHRLPIEGLWSQWSSNNRCPNADECWRACPVGAQYGEEYTIEYDDGNVSDNRGVCNYTFGCFNAEDAYLLEACEESE